MSKFVQYLKSSESVDSKEVKFDLKKLKRNENKNLEYTKTGFVGRKQARRVLLKDVEGGEYRLKVQSLRGSFLMELAIEKQVTNKLEGFRSILKKVIPEKVKFSTGLVLQQTDLPATIEFLITKVDSERKDKKNLKSKFEVSCEYYDEFVLENMWQVGKKIGEGGHGKVYTGLNERNGKIIAIKEIMIDEDSEDDSALKMIENEINVLKQLKHQNVVKYLGFQKKDDNIYFFMDFIAGGSITDIIKHFALRESLLQNYVKQILCGIGYLHSKNVVHRDIKPGNILYSKDGNIYITDFGESKKITKKLKGKAFIAGTPSYLAPEILEKNVYSKASDVYAIGSTILELITGKPALYDVFETQKFDAIKYIEYLKKNLHVYEKIKIPEAIPEDLKDLLRRCFEVDRKKRITIPEMVQHKWLTKEIEAKKDKVVFRRVELEEADDDVMSLDGGIDWSDVFDEKEIEEEDKEHEEEKKKKERLSIGVSAFLNFVKLKN